MAETSGIAGKEIEMAILRRYFDNPHCFGEPQWEPIDEETARKVLAQFFVDAELALVDIAAGCVICTDRAEYKRSGRGVTYSPPAG